MDSGSDWDSFSGSPSLPSNSALKSTNQEIKGNGQTNADFQSVELEDKSQLHERMVRGNKKKEKFSLSKADQPPYTQFQVTDRTMEPLNDVTNNNNSRKSKYVNETMKNNDDNSWDMEDSYNDVAQNVDAVYADSTLQEDPSVKYYPRKEQAHQGAPVQTYNSPKTDDLPIISSRRKSVRSKYKNNVTNDTAANNNGSQVVVDYEKQWWTLNRCETVLMMPEKDLETIDGDVKKGRTEKFLYEKSYYNVYTVPEAKKRKIPTFAQEEINPQVQRVWQEVNGVLQIFLDFFIIFLLETLKLILVTVFKKLIVGVIRLTGDHALKPLFAAVFNSFLQPTFVLFWNMTTGVRNILQPLVYLLGDMSIPLSNVIRAFRLVEYKNDKVSTPP